MRILIVYIAGVYLVSWQHETVKKLKTVPMICMASGQH